MTNNSTINEILKLAYSAVPDDVKIDGTRLIEIHDKIGEILKNRTGKITVSHFRKFYDMFMNENISMSRMVEMMNEVAHNKQICKSCGYALDAHAIEETGLCTACFTSNA